MITNSKIIDRNAVSVVEVALKVSKKGNNPVNFFTKPYIEKLYSYATNCREESKDRWLKKIDYTFISIGKKSNNEVITILDSIECAGDIMQAIDEGKTKQEVKELLDSFGISGERLVYVTGIMLEYSKYGIEFHDEYLKPHKELACDMINTLYLYEKINRANKIKEAKQKAMGEFK